MFSSDRLDGIQVGKQLKHQSMSEYLELSDDYNLRKSEPGKKRVRPIRRHTCNILLTDANFEVQMTVQIKSDTEEALLSRQMNQSCYL